jgi:ribosome-binding factor A
MPQHTAKRPPSQRQLKVGEEIRHAVATVLMRNETHDPTLESLSITVSEVRISPDLKNASLYVTPLGGHADAQGIIERLNVAAPAIRRESGKRLHLKYLPKLYFKLDKSFDYAGRINELLMTDPKIQRDVAVVDDAGEGARPNAEPSPSAHPSD